RGGSGGLETSCLALGLARAALCFLREETKNRQELAETHASFDQRLTEARAEMFHLAETLATPAQTSALRAAANALVLSATQAALTAAKGAGFVRGHPAQRWARQALFFLVWSCPWPAAAATLAHLAGPISTCE